MPAHVLIRGCGLRLPLVLRLPRKVARRGGPAMVDTIGAGYLWQLFGWLRAPTAIFLEAAHAHGRSYYCVACVMLAVGGCYSGRGGWGRGARGISSPTMWPQCIKGNYNTFKERSVRCSVRAAWSYTTTFRYDTLFVSTVLARLRRARTVLSSMTHASWPMAHGS